MPKKEYTSLPINYPVCEHSSCLMAATCLHQVAYSMMLEQNEEYLHLINPTRCSKDEACTYYRDKKPVVFARGFTNFQKRMYPQQNEMFFKLYLINALQTQALNAEVASASFESEENVHDEDHVSDDQEVY